MTKQKTTKKALLLSALALFVCIAMFIGSTFAWFTDSVTSGSNVIEAGTLDIVMEYWDGDSWEDAEGKVLEFQKASTSAGTEVLWEPGCTYQLPKIRVRNEGNLATYVVLKVNGITGDEKLMEVIEFENKISNVPESMRNGSQAILPNGYGYAQIEGKSIGLLYGTPDGTIIYDWQLAPKGEETPNSGNTDTSAEFTISGHMKEEAGNEYQNLKIEGVSITALATQTVYEYDSFGRDYDKNATLPEVIVTADDLDDALKTGGTVTLDSNINLGKKQITIPTGVDAVINLNGKDLTGDYSGADHYSMFTIPDGASLTINGDGKVTAKTEATENNRSLALFQNAGELTLNGGTYNVTDSSDGKTWIIATIVDNRTKSKTNNAKLTINGGNYSVGGNAINLFRNYPQQGGTATLIINSGTFKANPDKSTTYIWNQEAGSYLGELYFNGGTYDSNVVYEDYNGQSDIHIANGVAIQGYSGNN